MHHTGTTELRSAIYAALLNIIHLERGLELAFAPITDPEQRRELLAAKANILRALDLEAAEKGG